MKVKYSVSFEFLRQPTVTHRGVVSGGRVHTCVQRATKEAQAALRPVGWSSMVCVLLERLDVDPVAEDDNTDEAEVAEFTEPV